MFESPTSVNDLSAALLRPVALPPELSPCRAIEAMVAFRGALYIALAPVDDRPAAVWRLDPGTLAWRPVPERAAQGQERGRRRMRRPAVLSADISGSGLPGRHPGLASMAVFQGEGDAAPCLYVAAGGPSGPRLLRCADGESLETVLGVPAEAGYLGFAALTVWNDRLVMTSAAHLPGAAPDAGWSALPRGCVLASRDPAAADRWEVLSEPGFGDPDNLAVTALAVDRGRLCAGTCNPAAGFQIWAMPAEGATGWTCLMRQGAARHGMNPQVAALASHHGHLWIGTGMDAPAHEEVGWPAAELLRIEPDGEWELIAGETRLTPEGFRLPLSLLGPGLEDPGVTRLGVIAALPDGGPEEGLVLGGGPLAGLWSSRDGETWEPLLDEAADQDTGDWSSEGGPEGGLGGVTAVAIAEGRLWLAMDGGLFSLGPTT